jgi:hypothetical protein
MTPRIAIDVESPKMSRRFERYEKVWMAGKDITEEVIQQAVIARAKLNADPKD